MITKTDFKILNIKLKELLTKLFNDNNISDEKYREYHNDINNIKLILKRLEHKK